MLKFQLFNENFGSVNLKTDPDGSNDFELRLKRSKKSDGIFFEFSLDLSFVKEGRNFVRAVYENQGIDGIIGINIFSYNPNTYSFEKEYSGQLKLPTYKLDEATVDVTVEEVGFKRKFINLEDVDVNIGATQSREGVSLNTDPFIVLPLAPKTIKKKAIMQEGPNYIESGWVPGFPAYVRLGSGLNNTDFQNTFFGPDAWISSSTEIPSDVKNYLLEVTESGNYVIDFSNLLLDFFIEVNFIGLANISNLTSWDLKIRYQLNEGPIEDLWTENYTPGAGTFTPPDPIPTGEFDRAEYGDQSGTTTVIYYKDNLNPNIPNKNLSLDVGDEIYVWIESSIDFVGDGDSNRNVAFKLSEDAEFFIEGDTIFPQTTTKAVMIYEFLEKICQVLTDRTDCFRSDYFGRTDSTVAYPQDGEGSLLAITNGRSIRQLENQTLFANWKEAYESIEAVHCIGWGFEKLPDGTDIIRVEPKNYFYDKSSPALTLGQVSNLTKKVERDLYYQNIVVGYPKVENINQVNGIDEFNTERRFASPVNQAKGELDIRSTYRASGFEIESQRRLIGTTEESRIDDENFFVVVKRDGSGGFEVEQGSDFESVTGVFDPDTAYNLRISPARNVRRWGKVIASNVIKKSDKALKFTYGTFNYTASSKLPGDAVINENGDFDLTGIEAIYHPESIEFEGELTRQQRNTLRNNLYKYISFEDWEGNLVEGFVLDVQAELEANKGKFTILRVFKF